MCIGVIALVLGIDRGEHVALVDYGDGVPRKALVGIIGEEIEAGDLVIVHAGVIVSKMTIEELVDQLEFFKELIGESSPSLENTYMYLLKESERLKKKEG